LIKEADMVRASKLIHVAPNLKVTLNMVTWKEMSSTNMILETYTREKCIVGIETGKEL